MKRFNIFLIFLGLSFSLPAQLGLNSGAGNNSAPTKLTLGANPTVVGNEFVLSSVISARSGLSSGDVIEIPGEKIALAIKRIWEMELFSDVKIFESKRIQNVVFLEIHVKELPRIGDFGIVGISKGQAEDLRDRLAIQKNGPLSFGYKKNLKTKAEDFFVEKGYNQAQVTLTESEVDSNGRVDLLIKIDRGPKMRIKTIYFDGIENTHPRNLRKVMRGTKRMVQIAPKTPHKPLQLKDSLSLPFVVRSLGNLSTRRVMNFLSERANLNVMASSSFKKGDYEADKKAVIAYYNSLGFRDAKIVEDSVIIERSRIYILMRIEEGKRYYFRNLDWKGNTKYTNEQLSQRLGIKKGSVYNQSLLDQRLFLDPASTDISSAYLDKGYLFFNVEAKEVGVEGDSIDLEFRIYEGPQATIDKVIIYGNDRTKEHVIRRELRTYPGDKFSREAIIRSQRELANLGYFDPEQIGIRPIPHPENGTVDIEYTVVERSNDQVELSLGWGGRNNGLIGSAGVQFNNFSLSNIFDFDTWNPLPQGDGQRLSFRLNTNGKAYQTYNISFTEPWFGGKKPNSLSVGVFRQILRDRSQDSLRNSDPNLRRFVSNGLTLSYGIRLKQPDDFFSLITTLNLQNYVLQNWNRNNFIIENGRANNFNLKITLQRNDLDQFLYPTTGSSISLSGQWTPPYSGNRDFSDSGNAFKFKWIEFHKYRLNAEFYTPLDGRKKLVLKLGAKLGWLGFYNPSIGLSPFERFVVGGDGIANYTLYGLDVISLRGYDPFTPNEGHPAFTKFTAEIRYPFSTNPNATIYGLLFAEGGNSWLSLNSFDPYNLNRSVGIGLRAFLPMFGLLGVDYGIPFDSPPSNGLDTDLKGLDYILSNGRFRILLGQEPQ